MNRPLRGALTLLALTPVLLSGQTDAAQKTRKRGPICKDDIDTLVEVVRAAAMRAPSRELGTGSVQATAQILCAMAHCHRRYHIGDGPVVRPSLDFLIQHRGRDGGFGDAASTAWVAEALHAIDPDGFQAEVADARACLGKQKATVDVWQTAVSQVLDQVRSDVFPQDIAKPALAKTRDWFEHPESLQATDAAAALVTLVACQEANRELDAAQGTPAVTFSPAQQKAFDWLLGQQKDGVAYMKMGDKSFPDPGFTSFLLQALQTKPKDKRSKSDQETIDKGIQWLLAGQNKDGSFGRQLTNYVTCVAVGALARSEDPAVKPALLKAQAYILALQNVEKQGYQRKDRDYGSIGYGDMQRGDLSNTQFAMEALRLTGLPADHEAFAKAMVFLQRTQNLKSVNDFAGKVPDAGGQLMDVGSGDDGGAAYYPGNSPMGYIDLPDGTKVPRSYGSMTYALLKAYTLAGVKPDDARIMAAVKWLQGNWTLSENPGADPKLLAGKDGEKIKYQGLFYYYMVLAQALDGAGLAELQTAGKDGKVEVVAWRKALRSHLEAQQQQDGTWVNSKNDRWYEGMPLLATAYAMLALEHCR